MNHTNNIQDGGKASAVIKLFNSFAAPILLYNSEI